MEDTPHLVTHFMAAGAEKRLEDYHFLRNTYETISGQETQLNRILRMLGEDEYCLNWRVDLLPVGKARSRSLYGFDRSTSTIVLKGNLAYERLRELEQENSRGTKPPTIPTTSRRVQELRERRQRLSEQRELTSLSSYGRSGRSATPSSRLEALAEFDTALAESQAKRKREAEENRLKSLKNDENELAERRHEKFRTTFDNEKSKQQDDESNKYLTKTTSSYDTRKYEKSKQQEDESNKYTTKRSRLNDNQEDDSDKSQKSSNKYDHDKSGDIELISFTVRCQPILSTNKDQDDKTPTVRLLCQWASPRSSSAIDYFIVERQLDDKEWLPIGEKINKLSNQTQLDIASWNNDNETDVNRPAYFRLKAHLQNGQTFTSKSTDGIFIKLLEEKDIIKPDVEILSSNSVQLTWTDDNEDKEKSNIYDIEKKEEQQPEWKKVTEVPLSQRSARIDSLTDAEQCQFRLIPSASESEENKQTEGDKYKSSSESEARKKSEADKYKPSFESEENKKTDDDKYKTSSESDTRKKSDAGKFKPSAESEENEEIDDDKYKTSSISEARKKSDAEKYKSTSESDTRKKSDAGKYKSSAESEENEETDSDKYRTSSKFEEDKKAAAGKDKSTSESDARKKSDTGKYKPSAESEENEETDDDKYKTSSTSEARKKSDAGKYKSSAESEENEETDSDKYKTSSKFEEDKKAAADKDKSSSESDAHKKSDAGKYKPSAESEENEETDNDKYKSSSTSEARKKSDADKYKPSAESEENEETDDDKYKTSSTSDGRKKSDAGKYKPSLEPEENEETDDDKYKTSSKFEGDKKTKDNQAEPDVLTVQNVNELLKSLHIAPKSPTTVDVDISEEGFKDFDSFKIEYTTSNQPNQWKKASNITFDNPHLTIDNLKQGTDYKFRFTPVLTDTTKATINEANFSQLSLVLDVKTPSARRDRFAKTESETPQPTSPQFAIQQIDPTTVLIEAVVPPEETPTFKDTFEVYSKNETVEDDDWAKVGTIDKENLSTTVENLEENTSYAFKIDNITSPLSDNQNNTIQEFKHDTTPKKQFDPTLFLEKVEQSLENVVNGLMQAAAGHHTLEEPVNKSLNEVIKEVFRDEKLVPNEKFGFDTLALNNDLQLFRGPKQMMLKELEINETIDLSEHYGEIIIHNYCTLQQSVSVREEKGNTTVENIDGDIIIRNVTSDVLLRNESTNNKLSMNIVGQAFLKGVQGSLIASKFKGIIVVKNVHKP